MFKNLLRTVPVSGYRTRTALNLAGGHPLLQELSKNPTQFSRKVKNLLSGSTLNVTRGLSGQIHYRREMYSMWLVGCQSMDISAARPHKIILRIYPSASGQLVDINLRAVSSPLMGFDRRKNIEILGSNSSAHPSLPSNSSSTASLHQQLHTARESRMALTHNLPIYWFRPRLSV